MMESLYFEYNFEHVRSIGRIIKEYKYSHVGLNKKYLKNESIGILKTSFDMLIQNLVMLNIETFIFCD